MSAGTIRSMTKAIVTEKLKADAVEMAGGDQADGELVRTLMKMNAKSLVKWMQERQAASPHGEQPPEEEEDEFSVVNRFSGLKGSRNI